MFSFETFAEQRKSIIFPRDAGLLGTTKPVAIVLFPSDGVSDCATGSIYTLDLHEKRGYGIANKKTRLLFGKMPDQQSFKPAMLMMSKITGLTLMITSHGAPGWFFAEKSPLGGSRGCDCRC